MAKIVEQALGGEYTVTVQPYASPTVAMKAVMNGDGEIAYTADIGMTQFSERVGGFKDYKPHEAGARAHLVRLSDGIDDGDRGQGCRQVQVLEGLQRQAGVLHPGRLHELAELAAHLQGARLRLQARPDRPEVECRRVGGRHDRRLGRPTPPPAVARVLLEGDRNPHGRQGRQSVPGRDRQAQGGRSRGRRRRSEGRVHARTSARRRSRACRSCSATTRGSTCRRTSSTRWSRRSTTRRTSW